MAIADLDTKVGALADELVDTRRDLHRIPELGFEEHETAHYVADRLRALGLEPRTGVAGTGVVALVEGMHPGPTLLLRADMDGLPIEERTGLPYASTHPGRMHACGHDAHMSILLAVARVLRGERERLHGRVKLVFQPAEEGPGGAAPMIEAGVLEDPKVDAALGCHVWNLMPAGEVGVRAGTLMAASDRIRITVEGDGGHGAMPHLASDAIVAAAQVVTALQSIVSRRVSPFAPAVVTIGTIQGGYKNNVIADRVEMTGTVRTLDDDLWRQMPRHLDQIVQGVCAAMGVRGAVEYERAYPAVVNDAGMADLVRAAAAGAVGAERVVEPEQSMGGEDMSFFLRSVPGCFFFVGSRNQTKGVYQPHHHPAFDIDEDAMATAVKVFTASALRYLGVPA